MVTTDMSGHIQKQWTRSLERIFEEAYLSGELKLSGCKLKDFPKVEKYPSSVKNDLQDTVVAGGSLASWLLVLQTHSKPHYVGTVTYNSNVYFYLNPYFHIEKSDILLQKRDVIFKNYFNIMPSRKRCLNPFWKAAHLSKNRFTELPEEVTEFIFLEKLHLHHNTIRVIPETVALLQSLSYLDISHNQLTELPREICRLPLQTLLIAYNRLVLLPEELGRMSILSELDVGCNEITSLPSRIGDLPRIRSLDLRSNFLEQIPIEVTYLKLIKLDISGNRISFLPNELRKMKTLVELKLLDNPLTLPPAALCIRGRIHIFKYLERQAAKHDRTVGGRAYRGSSEARSYATSDLYSQPWHNIISGHNNNEALNKHWFYEVKKIATSNQVDHALYKESSQCSMSLLSEANYHKSCSETSTPSTISPKNSTYFEEEPKKVTMVNVQVEKKNVSPRPSNNSEKIENLFSTMYKTSLRPLNPSDVPEVEKLLENNTTLPNQLREKVCLSSFENREENKSFNHIQTYREYKEALKQQRLSDGLSAYKSREQVIFPENSNSNDKVNLKNMSMSTIQSKQIFCGGTTDKRPVQKVTPSIINQDTLFSNNSNNTSNHKNFNQYGRTSTQSNSPIKTKSDHLFEIINPERSSNFSKTAVLSNEGNADSNQMCRPRSPQNITWNINSSENYSFTMRREYERAKEEADLIQQLRRHIETRLKITLPNELAPALADGVVLCHLANYVRPHSVASIHVPSPAVPKLTMARCRRNVDNFLEACRKIGVDEEVLLDADAIMDVGYIGTFGLASLHRLVSTLIFYAEEYFQESETCSVNTIQDHILSTVLAAKLICCASDVLEGNRGIVRVATTVMEMLGFY